MRDRTSSIGPTAAIVGLFGLCCGLPVLLSLGVLGAVAGVSLQSWALIALGLGLAFFGSARWSKSARQADPGCGVGGSSTPPDPKPEQAPDTLTKGTSS